MSRAESLAAWALGWRPAQGCHWHVARSGPVRRGSRATGFWRYDNIRASTRPGGRDRICDRSVWRRALLPARALRRLARAGCHWHPARCGPGCGVEGVCVWGQGARVFPTREVGFTHPTRTLRIMPQGGETHVYRSEPAGVIDRGEIARPFPVIEVEQAVGAGRAAPHLVGQRGEKRFFAQPAGAQARL